MRNEEQTLAKDIAFGKTKRFLLPSGREVEIREQNGHDDDILSNNADSADGSNIDNFISSIVVRAFWKTGSSQRITPAEARKLLIKDRLVILIQSRIHSIGAEMEFDFDWGPDPKTGGKYNYSEDLLQYLWDYTKPFPEEYILNSDNVPVPNPEYFKGRISPYHEGAYDKQLKTLSSGKQVRLNLLDGESQAYVLNLREVTKNSSLIAMNIELQTGPDTWVKVENFSNFTSRDMIELRTWVKDFDINYVPYTLLEHPATKETIEYPIMNHYSFFYPEGI